MDESVISEAAKMPFKVPEESLKRVNDVIDKLPLMGDNSPIVIVSVYLLTVLVVLPNFMKDRKPYQLKSFIHFYNITQILYSSYNLYLALLVGIPVLDLLSPVCHHRQTFDVDDQIIRSNVGWWFMFAKVIEMSETAVFVLRKKDNQVSFLHVYHHVSSFLMTWYILKAIPDEYTFVTMILNSAVHVIMYTYYAVSALGPTYQKYVQWCKKYITTIQLIQFFLFIIYLSMAKFSNCNYKQLYLNVLFGNIVIFIILFFNFYMKSYNKKNIKNT